MPKEVGREEGGAGGRGAAVRIATRDRSSSNPTLFTALIPPCRWRCTPSPPHISVMSRFKSFAKDPADLVITSLAGLVRANPALILIPEEKVVIRQSSAKKVIVLSGGGSGHEPAHAGYVGEGMLDAAVSGSLFASPSTKQILSGLKQFEGPEGYVLIVKNYTGDVLHFGLAAEKLKATGKQVSMIIVGDDVSVGKAKGGLVGRRGLAGTVIVHKTAGAAAEAGYSLQDVQRYAKSVADNLVTIGASLDHCSIPGRDPAQQISLADDEIEIGMGIHNEPGVQTLKPIPSRPELVKNLLAALVSGKEPDRSFVDFASGDEIVLMVNNLGGLSTLELNAFADIAAGELEKTYGLTIRRIYSGLFMTALDGPGISFTILNLTRAGAGDILTLLDAPTSAPGWTPKPWGKSAGTDYVPKTLGVAHGSTPAMPIDAVKAKKLLEAACESIFKNEPKITLYDTVAGDGDCGETLVNGASAILSALKNESLHLADAVQLTLEIVDIVEDSMGGTSGGLYAIFLSAFAVALGANAESAAFDKAKLSSALEFALDSLYHYTRARPGDRTLIDAVAPFVTSLAKTGDFSVAVSEARAGFDSTRKLEAKFGRASYVAESAIHQFDSEGGLPDPGALGVVAILEGFLSVE
ncbi:Dak1 domain-containing protein [Limtongia smithiae]|uniref:Dak1 domain-containing protein n=1 Tax=Limtongia smithiae TaxID=1125753 RepID=UPI0034CF18C2